ncbi:unnamed protein product [Closterium sp. Naga37s-1]|nr:unnamed protein product [Closterium sp. Naga37s-1]
MEGENIWSNPLPVEGSAWEGGLRWGDSHAAVGDLRREQCDKNAGDSIEGDAWTFDDTEGAGCDDEVVGSWVGEMNEGDGEVEEERSEVWEGGMGLGMGMCFDSTWSHGASAFPPGAASAEFELAQAAEPAGPASESAASAADNAARRSRGRNSTAGGAFASAAPTTGAAAAGGACWSAEEVKRLLAALEQQSQRVLLAQQKQQRSREWGHLQGQQGVGEYRDEVERVLQGDGAGRWMGIGEGDDVGGTDVVDELARGHAELAGEVDEVADADERLKQMVAKAARQLDEDPFSPAIAVSATTAAATADVAAPDASPAPAALALADPSGMTAATTDAATLPAIAPAGEPTANTITPAVSPTSPLHSKESDNSGSLTGHLGSEGVGGSGRGDEGGTFFDEAKELERELVARWGRGGDREAGEADSEWAQGGVKGEARDGGRGAAREDGESARGGEEEEERTFFDELEGLQEELQGLTLGEGFVSSANEVTEPDRGTSACNSVIVTTGTSNSSKSTRSDFSFEGACSFATGSGARERPQPARGEGSHTIPLACTRDRAQLSPTPPEAAFPALLETTPRAVLAGGVQEKSGGAVGAQRVEQGRVQRGKAQLGSRSGAKGRLRGGGFKRGFLLGGEGRTGKEKGNGVVGESVVEGTWKEGGGERASRASGDSRGPSHATPAATPTDEAQAAFACVHPLCMAVVDARGDHQQLPRVIKRLEEAIGCKDVPVGGLQACLEFLLFPLLLVLSPPAPTSIPSSAPTSLSLVSPTAAPSKPPAAAAPGEAKPSSTENESVSGIVPCGRQRVVEAALSCMHVALTRCSVRSHDQAASLLRFLASATTPTPQPPPTSNTNPSEQEAAPLLGHLLSNMLSAAEAEARLGTRGSQVVRVEALRAVHLLVAAAHTPDALAFFLPGILSGLSRAALSPFSPPSNEPLTRGAAADPSAVAEALLGLSQALVLVMGDACNEDGHGRVSYNEDKGQQQRGREGKVGGVKRSGGRGVGREEKREESEEGSESGETEEERALSMLQQMVGRMEGRKGEGSKGGGEGEEDLLGEPVMSAGELQGDKASGTAGTREGAVILREVSVRRRHEEERNTPRAHVGTGMGRGGARGAGEGGRGGDGGARGAGGGVGRGMVVLRVERDEAWHRETGAKVLVLLQKVLPKVSSHRTVLLPSSIPRLTSAHLASPTRTCSVEFRPLLRRLKSRLACRIPSSLCNHPPRSYSSPFLALQPPTTLILLPLPRASHCLPNLDITPPPVPSFLPPPAPPTAAALPRPQGPLCPIRPAGGAATALLLLPLRLPPSAARESLSFCALCLSILSLFGKSCGEQHQHQHMRHLAPVAALASPPPCFSSSLLLLLLASPPACFSSCLLLLLLASPPPCFSSSLLLLLLASPPPCFSSSLLLLLLAFQKCLSHTSAARQYFGWGRGECLLLLASDDWPSVASSARRLLARVVITHPTPAPPSLLPSVAAATGGAVRQQCTRAGCIEVATDNLVELVERHMASLATPAPPTTLSSTFSLPLHSPLLTSPILSPSISPVSSPSHLQATTASLRVLSAGLITAGPLPSAHHILDPAFSARLSTAISLHMPFAPGSPHTLDSSPAPALALPPLLGSAVASGESPALRSVATGEESEEERWRRWFWVVLDHREGRHNLNGSSDLSGASEPSVEEKEREEEEQRAQWLKAVAQREDRWHAVVGPVVRSVLGELLNEDLWELPVDVTQGGGRVVQSGAGGEWMGEEERRGMMRAPPLPLSSALSPRSITCHKLRCAAPRLPSTAALARLSPRPCLLCCCTCPLRHHPIVRVPLGASPSTPLLSPPLIVLTHPYTLVFSAAVAHAITTLLCDPLMPVAACVCLLIASPTSHAAACLGSRQATWTLPLPLCAMARPHACHHLLLPFLLISLPLMQVALLVAANMDYAIATVCTGLSTLHCHPSAPCLLLALMHLLPLVPATAAAPVVPVAPALPVEHAAAAAAAAAAAVAAPATVASVLPSAFESMLPLIIHPIRSLLASLQITARLQHAPHIVTLVQVLRVLMSACAVATSAKRTDAEAAASVAIAVLRREEQARRKQLRKLRRAKEGCGGGGEGRVGVNYLSSRDKPDPQHINRVCPDSEAAGLASSPASSGPGLVAQDTGSSSTRYRCGDSSSGGTDNGSARDSKSSGDPGDPGDPGVRALFTRRMQAAAAAVRCEGPLSGTEAVEGKEDEVEDEMSKEQEREGEGNSSDEEWDNLGSDSKSEADDKEEAREGGNAAGVGSRHEGREGREQWSVRHALSQLSDRTRVVAMHAQLAAACLEACGPLMASRDAELALLAADVAQASVAAMSAADVAQRARANELEAVREVVRLRVKRAKTHLTTLHDSGLGTDPAIGWGPGLGGGPGSGLLDWLEDDVAGLRADLASLQDDVAAMHDTEDALKVADAVRDETNWLLPRVHMIWPHAVSGLKRSHPALIVSSIHVITALSTTCDDAFMARKIREDSWPLMAALLLQGPSLPSHSSPSSSRSSPSTPFLASISSRRLTNPSPTTSASTSTRNTATSASSGVAPSARERVRMAVLTWIAEVAQSDRSREGGGVALRSVACDVMVVLMAMLAEGGCGGEELTHAFCTGSSSSSSSAPRPSLMKTAAEAAVSLGRAHKENVTTFLSQAIQSSAAAMAVPLVRTTSADSPLRAPASLIPDADCLDVPTVLVVLPDGSVRLYDTPRLTVCDVLCNYPSHALSCTSTGPLLQQQRVLNLNATYYLRRVSLPAAAAAAAAEAPSASIVSVPGLDLQCAPFAAAHSPHVAAGCPKEALDSFYAPGEEIKMARSASALNLEQTRARWDHVAERRTSSWDAADPEPRRHDVSNGIIRGDRHINPILAEVSSVI